MLRDRADIDRHCRWPDVKKKIESDSRYRAVDSSILREDYFLEYCKIMKEEKKRMRDRERDRKEKDKKSDRRDKEKSRHKDSDEEKVQKKKSDDHVSMMQG